ncbi:hypothetical protein HXX76_007998 [Chlamydomonas incerta]|uniref:FAS1 domain-containing protein n=1 Tax=Chlamydomonas incerta TaxID=51695 RepID=A0A835SWA5_CHLIN|nr:hypothetical protein HXX76_007998 [Chlamydomonas incerta]|eukprot:KAG2434273.1 hypothetical protein HXX76_007998 [Chlamydomonas incerta]
MLPTPPSSPSPSPSPAGPASLGAYLAQPAALPAALSGALVTSLDPPQAQALSDPATRATLFLPAPAVLAASPALTALLANPQANILAIKALLLNHLVLGTNLANAAAISAGLQLTSVAGNPLTFSVEGGVVKVNGVVISNPMPVGQATVWQAAGVIVPPSAPLPSPSPSPSPVPSGVGPAPTGFATLSEALRGTPGLSVMGAIYDAVLASQVGPIMQSLLAPPFTVFAPGNEALQAALQALNIQDLTAAAATQPLTIAGIMLPHIAFGRALPSSALTAGLKVATGLPQFGISTSLTVQVAGDTGAVSLVGPTNTVGVAPGDVFAGAASNIVVHIVDAVIRV